MIKQADSVDIACDLLEKFATSPRG